MDYLASRLIEHHWEVKPLHRLIVLSSTYRQSTESPSSGAGRKLDPENTFHWHFAKRRLSAEEIRDAMLAISGQLDYTMGGPSVMLPVDEALIAELYNPGQWNVADNPNDHARRSVYLMAKRNLRLPFMEVFDQPTLQSSCACRESSTHAPQALELLNGSISNSLATAFAERLQREAGADRSRVIERAFRLATGRPPTGRESQLADEYLRDGSLREFALAIFNLNAFLYVR